MTDRGQSLPLAGARSRQIREIAAQAARFAAVGAFNTLFDFAVFNALMFAGLSPIPANVVSVTVSIAISFAANRTLVFRHREGNALKQGVAFFAVTAFGMYVLQTAVIVVLLDVWSWPLDGAMGLVGSLGLTSGGDELVRANAAKAAATVVSLTWNFLSYRYVVFRKATPSTILPMFSFFSMRS
jgi:putative flippase GtrA